MRRAGVPICHSREPIVDRTEVTFLRKKVPKATFHSELRC